MPIYRKSAGGGLGIVIRMTSLGKTKIYKPSADTSAARGVALTAALAVSVEGDIIYLGQGFFEGVFVVPDGVAVRGSGIFVTSVQAPGDTATITYTGGAPGAFLLGDLAVGAVVVNGGAMIADRVRFDSRGTTATTPVNLVAGNLTADNCHFLAPGVVASITSSVPATQAALSACVANNALHANVLPVPEQGITIDALYA